MAGLPYPREELAEAWELTLFNQFHDTLCGTAIAPAYDDSRDQYGHACSLAGNAFNRAVQVIARQIDIPAEPEMAPVVVFNPHPWRLRADVELEFKGFTTGRARMTDEHGAAVAVQATRSRAMVEGSRGRLVFGADVPPLGYRVYRIYPTDLAPSETVTATETTLENDFLALEVDPGTGWLSRLEDKRTGVDLVAGRSGAHAVVVDDRSDTWGHRVRAFDDVVGEFECTSVRLVEEGPVRAILRIESRYGRSTLTEEILLGADAPYVDVRVVLDWRERHKLLKLRFPAAIETGQATFEIPYAYLERPADGDEEPAQAWVDVAGALADGSRAGLAVLNDGKYGHDARGGEIGMTVARSPVYAWHDPKVFDEDGIYEYLDQGCQELTYRLVPHAGDWRAAGVVRAAAELNQPLFALLESYHAGPLPQASSYADDGEDAVVMTVLKAAEDAEGGVVVRAYESTGRPAHASIALPLVDRSIDAEFGAYEIKTFLLPHDPDKPVVETNLLEWPERPPVQPPAEAEPGEEPAATAVAEPEVAPQEGPAGPRGR